MFAMLLIYHINTKTYIVKLSMIKVSILYADAKFRKASLRFSKMLQLYQASDSIFHSWHYILINIVLADTYC